jgi:hypothetical protein
MNLEVELKGKEGLELSLKEFQHLKSWGQKIIGKEWPGNRGRST